MEIIQPIQTHPNKKKAIHIHGRMEYNLARDMPNTTPMEAQKFQKIMNSQKKLIIIEKIFLDISMQMLEISYILSLGQLL
jgi:hypothetical protein